MVDQAMRQATQAGGTLRNVLVVEDDYMIARELADGLKAQGCHVIGPLADPALALELARKERPDFAVLDVNLNGRVVFPVADFLADENIPFVFASGYGTGIIPPRHRSAAFLEKPVTLDDVLDHLLPKRPAPARPRERGGLKSSNLILQAATGEDADLLRPHLQRLSIAERHVTRVGHGRVFFPETGLAVARLPGADRGSALAYIGPEGAVALPGPGVRLPFEYVWLTQAAVVAIERDRLASAISQSPHLAQLLAGYEQTIVLQMAWTAEATATLSVVDRLARAILMTSDRLGPQIPLTHGSLSETLSVRRAGITEALHKLEYDGAIRSTRSLVTVRERQLLRARVGATYGQSEEALAAILPGWPLWH
jgi:CRP-like cAMP-binding protein/ActR/RegA family two-component response regulator